MFTLAGEAAALAHCVQGQAIRPRQHGLLRRNAGAGVGLL